MSGRDAGPNSRIAHEQYELNDSAGEGASISLRNLLGIIYHELLGMKSPRRAAK